MFYHGVSPTTGNMRESTIGGSMDNPYVTNQSGLFLSHPVSAPSYIQIGSTHPHYLGISGSTTIYDYTQGLTIGSSPATYGPWPVGSGIFTACQSHIAKTVGSRTYIGEIMQDGITQVQNSTLVEMLLIINILEYSYQTKIKQAHMYLT